MEDLTDSSLSCRCSPVPRDIYRYASLSLPGLIVVRIPLNSLNRNHLLNHRSSDLSRVRSHPPVIPPLLTASRRVLLFLESSFNLFLQCKRCLSISQIEKIVLDRNQRKFGKLSFSSVSKNGLSGSLNLYN